jgi:hypothetical protein
MDQALGQGKRTLAAFDRQQQLGDRVRGFS